MIAGANWRLEDTENPAAALQENNPDTACMRISRMLCTWYLLLSINVHVCLETGVYGAFVSGLTDQRGHCVGVDSVLAACRWVEKAD